MHAVGSSQNDPARQSRHLLGDNTPDDIEYVPGEHVLHKESPVALIPEENVPAGHKPHDAIIAVAPEVVLNVPGWHKKQAEEASNEMYCPASHVKE